MKYDAAWIFLRHWIFQAGLKQDIAKNHYLIRIHYFQMFSSYFQYSIEKSSTLSQQILYKSYWNM